jgi:hypothetical protein
VQNAAAEEPATQPPYVSQQSPAPAGGAAHMPLAASQTVPAGRTTPLPNAQVLRGTWPQDPTAALEESQQMIGSVVEVDVLVVVDVDVVESNVLVVVSVTPRQP